MLEKVVRKLNYYRKFCINIHHLKILYLNWFKIKQPIQSDKIHLDACISWLKHAYEVSNEKGVSYGYHFGRGWLPSYPETSGYIIPTLIKFSEMSNTQEYFEMAKNISDWEINIQKRDGSVRVGNSKNETSDVFDTGMVLIGLTSIYEKTKAQRYLDAAKKAADWLVNIQDNDGKWSINSFKNIPHVYHSKVAWGLFKLYFITHESKYYNSGKASLNWIFEQKTENGWYKYMGFTEKGNAYTHTIAYTLQGFIEIAILLHKNDKLRSQIIKHLIEFTDRFLKNLNNESNRSTLLGEYNNWKHIGNYSCVTGDAQMAILLLHLFKITNKQEYYLYANALIKGVKQKHIIKGKNNFYDGGLSGSYPIQGRYHPYEYLNWAVKFFADALMLKLKINKV